MKYHTTIFNSIASLIMLLVILLVVLVLGGQALVPDIGSMVSQQVLQAISGSGDRTITVTSVESSIFKGIVLHDVQLEGTDGTVLLTIEKAKIDVPAYRFLWKRIYPKRIPLIFTGLSGDIERSDLNQFIPDDPSGTGSSDMLADLLKDRIITLSVDQGSLSYRQDTLQASLEGFSIFASVSDGVLDQVRLVTETFSFESDQLQGSGFSTIVTLGRTATAGVGIRFESEESRFSVPEIGLDSRFATWKASFITDSLEQLLQLEGSGAMTMDSVDASIDLGDESLDLLFGSIGIDAEILSGAFPSIDFRFPTMEASYEPWIGSLDNTSGTVAWQDDRLEVSLESPRTLSLRHDGQLVGALRQPVILFRDDTAISRLQIDIERVESDQPGYLANLVKYPLDTVERFAIDQAYLLAIREKDKGTVQTEASLSMVVETDIPLLNTVSGQFSGSIALDRSFTIDNSQFFVRELETDGLEGKVDANLLYGPSDSSSNRIDLQASHSSGIQLTAEHLLEDEFSRVSLRLDNMTPYGLIPLLERFSPTVSALVVPQTSLDGNINLTIDNDISVGRGTAEIGIANLAVDEQRFNIATTFTGSLHEDDLTVDLATLTTEGYRLAYSGTLDRLRLFPQGVLTVSDIENGNLMVSGDFEQIGGQQYGYRITSPFLAESSFAGDVSWAGDGSVNAQGVLEFPGASYPVSVEFQQDASYISLVSDNLIASLDFISVPGHITFNLETEQLLLPPAKGDILYGTGVVNGKIEADFSLAEELFLITSPQLQVDGLGWRDREVFSLAFSMDADMQEVRIQNILYSDQDGDLRGTISLRNNSLRELLAGNFNRFHAIADIRDDDESVTVSFFPDEADPSISRGTIITDKFSLGRFPWFTPETTLRFSFVGETDLHDVASGHGQWEFLVSENETSIQGKFHMERWGVLVENGLFRKGKATITIPEARFAYSGAVDITAEFARLWPLVWRDATTTARTQINTTFDSSDNVFSWIASIPTSLMNLPPITVSHTDVNLLGAVKWRDGTHDIVFEDGQMVVTRGEDGTVDGSYRFDTGDLNVRTFDGFPISMDMQGKVADGLLSLDIQNIEFNLGHLNAIFAEPIIIFEDDLAIGSLFLDGPVGDPDFYGTLRANEVTVSTFWTPGEKFSVKNPVMTVSENLAAIAASPVSAVHTSGRRTTGTAQMEFTLERWGFPHYRIDILSINDPISLWIPLEDIDINVEAMAAGSFSIDGTPTEETLYGDVVVSDGMISSGVPELPAWVVPKARTSIDMTLRTGRNVSFIYPNEDAPILRATFLDDQEIGISVVAPSMATTFTGELAFRSGEIYYVQKNFYITEGSLRFPTISSGLTEDFLPRLNLRARLREFEPDGTRIDIYMVLQEAQFDNLNPRFESIPLRSTNEILELLGQNIVAAGSAQDSGLSSVVAVASAATDVISRLGILQATTVSLGFSGIIRESLGLDVFTIRTNLLQNILFEALPGVASDTTVSPIARYLDNTTMYIGKYLLDDFYLQGMLHFRQNPLGNSMSFLANDLRIDTELSVEWTNPLATFSFFTQPDELSVFELFDTMGFSITKRFDF